jgi:hypothetical protein
MLESWIFMTALLGFCLIALFHGCILLFAPERYLPTYSWGRPTLRLARTPSFYLGKRFWGLCLSGVILGIFVRPAVAWILHPKTLEISSGQSLLPLGMARWDLFGFALLVAVGGYLLLTRPEKSVELMFAADKSKLLDKATLRLWTFHVQMAAFFMLLWCLLPMADFIRSFRR